MSSPTHGTLRLAPCEVHELRCISTFSGTQERCENGVFDVEEGKWEEVDIPYAPGRQGQQILNLTGGRMWAWVVNDFTFLAAGGSSSVSTTSNPAPRIM
ncbi:hypothetical protein Shyd_56660 [Streptomyces hydrogenans]|uniref:Uncharacterized protein n=1 Tax=Streptomyces hydrogenans TaxID=1873719 RepID=A0ABQ3PGY9_9ACTN|nr:hypothetical protein [Streptomyces hydrogenans]GHI24295.1 hypothetical protein Shyd_56660 [Streptomyces hydrogenans]